MLMDTRREGSVHTMNSDSTNNMWVIMRLFTWSLRTSRDVEASRAKWMINFAARILK